MNWIWNHPIVRVQKKGDIHEKGFDSRSRAPNMDVNNIKEHSSLFIYHDVQAHHTKRSADSERHFTIAPIMSIRGL